MSKNRRNQLRSVFNLAWSFVKEYGCSMGYALIKAWENVKLLERMSNDTWAFSYIKRDGTTRIAVGTVASGLVPATKGNGKSNPLVQTYYDIDRQAWRSFVKYNLIH